MEEVNYFLKIVGCIALFSFATRYLSESFQLLWGRLAHRTFESLTDNNIKSVFVGFGTTLILQSPSVSSVMLLGSVNTGLVNFSQGLFFVLGANVASTAMGWVISYSNYEVFFLFLSLGFIFSVLFKEVKVVSLGKIFFSLGLIFLSMYLMKELTLDSYYLKQKQMYVEFFQSIKELGWIFVALFCAVIVFLTRNISVVLVIGFVGYQLSIFSLSIALFVLSAVPLGLSFIGLYASFKAKRIARRVFLAEMIISFLGLGFLLFFMNDVLLSVEEFNFIEDLSVKEGVIRSSYYLAGLSSLYTCLLVVLGLGLNKLISEFTLFVIKEKKDKEMQSLRFWGGNFNLSPSLAIEQSYQELKKTAAMTHTVLSLAEEGLRANFTSVSVEKGNDSLFEQILKYEDITDKVQDEMSDFLNRMMQERITEEQAKKIQSVLRIIANLESITDHCLGLVKVVQKVKVESKENNQLFLFLTDRMSKVLSLYEFLFDAITEERDIDDSVVNNSVEKLSEELIDFKMFSAESEKKYRNEFLGCLLEIEGVKKSVVHVVEALQDRKRGSEII